MKTDLLSQVAPENRLLSRLSQASLTATDALVAVSFATEKGAQKLVQVLAPMLKRAKRAEIYLSGYMNITEPEALRRLRILAKAYPAQLKVFFDADSKFHCKFILLRQPKSRFEAYVGSSNLSASAFAEEGELNVRVAGTRSHPFFKHALVVEQHIKKDFSFEPLTEPAVADYAKRRGSGTGKSRKGGAGSGAGAGVKPNRKKGKAGAFDAITVPRVPVYVATRDFKTKETEILNDVQPSWEETIGYHSVFKNIMAGQCILVIERYPRKAARFGLPKFIGTDRVDGVGHVVGLRPCKYQALSVLEKWLGKTEKEIRSRDLKFLEPADVMILLKKLPKAFK